MSGHYCNEIDPYCAAWIRNLMAAGLVPEGDVDERSIADVRADDVASYAQCHFFAGICGWPLALRMAGWPADEPVWTGSCPCQPFSQAGKRKGVSDARHLWPEFYRLIRTCRPPVVAGEQVASKDGREWLSGVRADLEALGYEIGAADLCAAGIGAPHIRQRLWWVANGQRERLEKRERDQRIQQQTLEPFARQAVERGGNADGLAFTRLQSQGRGLRGPGQGDSKTVIGPSNQPRGPSGIGGMGKSNRDGSPARGQTAPALGYRDTAEPASFWSDFGIVSPRRKNAAH